MQPLGHLESGSLDQCIAPRPKAISTMMRFNMSDCSAGWPTKFAGSSGFKDD